MKLPENSQLLTIGAVTAGLIVAYQVGSGIQQSFANPSGSPLSDITAGIGLGLTKLETSAGQGAKGLIFGGGAGFLLFLLLPPPLDIAGLIGGMLLGYAAATQIQGTVTVTPPTT